MTIIVLNSSGIPLFSSSRGKNVGSSPFLKIESAVLKAISEAGTRTTMPAMAARKNAELWDALRKAYRTAEVINAIKITPAVLK